MQFHLWSISFILLSIASLTNAYIPGLSPKCELLWESLVQQIQQLPDEFASEVCYRRSCSPLQVAGTNHNHDLFENLFWPAVEETYHFMKIVRVPYPTALDDLQHVARVVGAVAEECAATHGIRNLCRPQSPEALANFRQCFEEAAVPAVVNRVGVFMPWLKRACSRLTPELVRTLWKRAVSANLRIYGAECNGY
jgi:hypothetical protein